MADYLVGSDVGTGGTKSVVIDKEGNVLGSHFIEYPLDTPRPGWAEHDPEIYWKAVADTIRQSIAQAGINNRNIRGVSISALSPACILVDKNLKPLQKAHIWMDRRATAECKWLKENIGEDRIFELSGNPTDPYYAVAKLMWEKNNRPELYKKTYKIQTAACYPRMKLTGKAVIDYSNASLMGICFDIRKKKWDEKLADEIGIDLDKLPDVYPCPEVIGEVTSEAAKETGLAAGTPVVAGTVDANAGWLAMGMVEDGDNSVTMGTAGCLGVCHEKPEFTKNMITIVHTANCEKTYTTLLALVSCGALIRYFRDNLGQLEMDTASKLGISEYDVLNLEAEKAPPGSDGLIVLPYFMGERTPIWDPLARGVLFGLSLAHTRGHIIRALMESAGYGMLHNLEMIRKSGLFIKPVLTMGEGGAHSRLWRQIISDILNVKGAYMAECPGAPLGNAINAGVGVGVYKNYDVAREWIKFSDRIEPNRDLNEKYMQLYKVYLNLYPALKDSFQDLALATGYI
jgi:sugar (pentulose or hexulose) kinase